ncbi:hypothetical protein EV175_002468, partial [Coemansia sp. RSA 1933]
QHGAFSGDERDKDRDNAPCLTRDISWTNKNKATYVDCKADGKTGITGEPLPKIMVGDRMLVGADLEDTADDDDEEEGVDEDEVDAGRLKMGMAHMPTFTQIYRANAAPGMWSSGGPGQPDEDKETQGAEGTEGTKPNMPLEPEEYDEPKVPWLVEQMGMGEQPLSSLLDDYVGYINPRAYTDSIASVDSSGIGHGYESDDGDGDRRHDRKRQRKQAFEVLRQQVAEARVGIPKTGAPPSAEEFRRADGTVDYVGLGGSRIKHYADTQLRHKMDYRHSSEDPCKLDRFLLTLQRLVEVSAPYQRLVVWLFQVARWDRPRQTAWWCGVYFALVYLEMVSLFAWLVPVFVIAYHRLRPSQAYQWLGLERAETSIIPRKFVHDASSSTIGKGLVANRMWEIWRDTLGAQVHLILADVADWMERAKNCATWKRPWASRAVIVVLVCMGLLSYLVPAHVFQKLVAVCAGVQFFFLAPLQLRHQRYRRVLWVIDWILWHAPTDVELALDTLYTSSHSHGGAMEACAVCADSASLAAKAHRFAHTIASDLMTAYYPFGKQRHSPVTILQTASSTCLDRLDEGSFDTIGDALELGKRLGKSLGKSHHEDDCEYSGLGANASVRLPAMMKDYEEREWIQAAGYARPVVPRAFSVDTLGAFDSEKVTASYPTKLAHTDMLSQIMSLDLHGGADTGQEAVHAASGSGSGSSSGGGGGGVAGGSSPTTDRSFISRAKGLSSRILHRRNSQGGDAPSHPTPADAAPAADLEEERRRRSMHLLRLRGMSLSKAQDLAPAAVGEFQAAGILTAQDVLLDKALDSAPAASSELHAADIPGARASLDSSIQRLASAESEPSSLELMHDANELSALRNRDARPAEKGVDLSSLYAFRCIHQGKYGTLFVTPDRFVFRRSRIMGGRRSSVSSHQLSCVVALRKSTSRFSKSNGIQLLMSDGSAFSFFGLARRDDVFGFLLVRCGHTHAF